MSDKPTYEIAFFDLDGTIVFGNAWGGILRYPKVNPIKVFLVRSANVPRVIMRKLYLLGHARYRAGWIRGLAWLMQRWHRHEIETFSDWLANDYLKPLYQRDVIERLKAHQADGTRVILVTSFFEEAAHAVAQRLGADGVIATQLDYKDDRTTGFVLGNTSVGSRRLAYIRSYLEAHNLTVNLKDCIGYANSYLDAPMLAAMGHAVAVHPDKNLLAAAEEQGWEIFRKPDNTAQKKATRF